MGNSIMRKEEYPNPAFVRSDTQILDGTWQFAFDDDNKMEKRGIANIHYPMTIQVPFCYQSQLSGICTDDTHENLWYTRRFTVTREQLGGEVLLHFGAVDFTAKVWVNGNYVGRHDGGNTSFAFEIADYLEAGENQITVKAEDSYSKEQPRGKQMWGKDPMMCWYTNTSGIWQSVWLEFTGKNYIKSVRITPDIDHNQAQFVIRAKQEDNISVKVVLKKENKLLGEMTVTPADGKAELLYTFREHVVRAQCELWWSPQCPNLIDVEVMLLQDGKEVDKVDTYFGMRKIHKEGNKIFLNNQNFYQRLVLDQGYWPDGMMTPPSGEALKKDVELTKAMGFNGVRKHQKIEDPRYYYWADKIGLVVWGELPSAYDFTPDSRKRQMDEMWAFIQRDYNHPCIINWVPVNESWGIWEAMDNRQQQNLIRSLYYMVKAEDPTRLVVGNDGWEQIDTTDICAIHDYAITPENAKERYADIHELLTGSVNSKPIYASGYSYNGVPILLTEMGGIKLEATNGWGYLSELKDEKEMLNYLRAIIAEIRKYPDICGFCYTQLTDVMQETNGLLSPEREPRADLEILKEIFG